MLILFNKPYHVLPQFTDADGRATLAQYINIPNVYPAGRLDYDSEGLMVLTDDGRIQHEISHPQSKTAKTYLAQVEGLPSSLALRTLCDGVMLNDGVAHAENVSITPPPLLWPRIPPVRFRKTVPDTWIELTLREGRNRQVRRMTAAVGHPTLRLVRVQIGAWHIGTLQPGEWRMVDSHR